MTAFLAGLGSRKAPPSEPFEARRCPGQWRRSDSAGSSPATSTWAVSLAATRPSTHRWTSGLRRGSSPDRAFGQIGQTRKAPQPRGGAGPARRPGASSGRLLPHRSHRAASPSVVDSGGQCRPPARSWTPRVPTLQSGQKFQLFGRHLACPAIGNELEAHLLTFPQIGDAGALHGADMDEGVRAAIVRRDEVVLTRCGGPSKSRFQERTSWRGANRISAKPSRPTVYRLS